jgi:L-lactate utilization protein LutB
MSTPKEVRNSKLGPKVADALKSRHFEAWYYDDPSKAADAVLSLIPKDHLVSWGGSMSAVELGIQDRLVKEGYKVIDRDKAASPQERHELMHKALLCDTFLAGSNAITEDGQLVNIDGGGNRVAAMCYGPKQVIVVAGMNKVVKTLDDAMTRARTIAAPVNQQRFADNKTPCKETGSCADCKSPDSICSFIVTTRLCKPAGRIKVILVGRDLGL